MLSLFSCIPISLKLIITGAVIPRLRVASWVINKEKNRRSLWRWLVQIEVYPMEVPIIQFNLKNPL